MRFVGLGLAAIVILAPFLGLVVWFVILARRRPKRFGYSSMGAYLRSAPRSDEERRDSVTLALTGLVFCFLGVLLPPLVLVGVVPLFYGGRKVVYASLGLGLVDDADQPGT
jgi:hypothetical protein